MKKLILICAIIVPLTFAACNSNVAEQEHEYEIIDIGEIGEPNSKVVTAAEKSQAAEKRLIEVLQSAIETIDNVNEAVINIDSPSETEKTVNVLVITNPNTQLTDEEKDGIIRQIKNSISNTVTVSLKEEQQSG